jgi:hypothetical protein
LGNSGFSAISCSSTRACTAVGFDPSGATAERLRGGRWSVQHVTRSAHSGLTAVSCPSSRFCEAVGFYNAHGGRPPVQNVVGQVSLAERWNGSRWTIQSTPRFSDGAFNGVSCTSSSDCIAVGSWLNGTLTEYWNGTKWSVQPDDSLNGYDELSAVSCASRNACLAVGFESNSTDPGSPITRKWNGMTWSDTFGNYGAPVLGAVSCPAANACSGVQDSSVTSGPPQRWNGAGWTSEPLRGSASLEAVSCPSRRICVAVGQKGVSLFVVRRS